MSERNELPADLPAFRDELMAQFEPRWPRYAMEWNKLKEFFAEDVQEDWARFLVEAAKPTSFKLWSYGISFHLFGEDLSSESTDSDK